MCWTLVVNILLANTKCARILNDRKIFMEWFFFFGSISLKMIAPKNKRIILLDKNTVKLVSYRD